MRRGEWPPLDAHTMLPSFSPRHTVDAFRHRKHCPIAGLVLATLVADSIQRAVFRSFQ